MRVSSSWRLSAGGVPVPPPPCGADRRGRAHLIVAARGFAEPVEVHARQQHVVDGVLRTPPCRQARHHQRCWPRDRLNSEGRRLWWRVPGRTLEAVLEHIKGTNSPRLEYPTLPSLSRRRSSSWTPRRMEIASSSSSGSRSHSSGSPTLLPIKPESLETPLGWRTRSGGIVINEDGSSSRLVKPKTESTLLPVKQEHLDMAALKWARESRRRWSASSRP
ncbi:Homeobox protein KNOX3 [Hordeum vulgare]|nr:Homeobox protein KNOX3 [Hordeum vulgare]